MQELEAKITETFRGLVESGRVDEIIRSKLEKCIEDIFDDTLRSYSPFGKSLREAVSAGLAFDVERLGVGGYQAMVVDIIKGKVDASLSGEWADKLKADVDELLRAAPATIKLSELLAKLAEDHEDEAAREEWEGATMIVDAPKHGSTWVSLSPSGERKSYMATWRFAVGENGEIFGLSVDGKEAKGLREGTLRGMERYIFQLQSGATKVELDLSPGVHEREYPEPDHCSC